LQHSWIAVEQSDVAVRKSNKAEEQLRFADAFSGKLRGKFRFPDGAGSMLHTANG
jgi:hypothetical protein